MMALDACLDSYSNQIFIFSFGRSEQSSLFTVDIYYGNYSPYPSFEAVHLFVHDGSHMGDVLGVIDWLFVSPKTIENEELQPCDRAVIFITFSDT